MTSQYGRGRETEYKAIEELTKQGYLCTRAASSKGNWDVIGICANHVRLISCKRSKNERLCNRHLVSERNRLGRIAVPENCQQEVWVWLDGRGWYARWIINPKDLDLTLARIYDPAFEKLRDKERQTIINIT